MNELTYSDYKLIFESLPELNLIVKPDFTMVAVSNSYLQATMTKREDLIGKNIFEIFPDNPEDPRAGATINLRASLNRVLANSASDAMAVQKYDIRQPLSEGGEFEERYWSPINTPVFDGNRKIIFIIHKVVDVTKFIKLKQGGLDKQVIDEELRLYSENMEAEIYLRILDRQRMLEQLAEAKIEAEKSSQEAIKANTAKSSFLATMSHEIRTPLNGIIGMTDLLLLTEQSPEQREYIATIHDSGEILLNTINDILDFSKIESGRFELDIVTFNLRDLIESTIESLALQAHLKGIAIGALVDQDVPNYVLGDQIRLGQVLKNLLNNAIKFTEVGQVSLNVNKIHSMQNENNSIVTLTFAIHDSGIGISGDTLNLLFQPFSQGDTSITRKYGGTGLGLVISQKIIHLMHGNIEVDSKLGHGSKFYFTISLQKANVSEQEEVERFDPQLHKVRVLVVDDNEINRQVLFSQLNSWGIRCDLVDNGEDALKMLHEAVDKHDQYSIAIVDCMMPIMDGIELSKKILTSRNLITVDVIMLTSIGIPVSVAELRNIGICLWLSKPVRQSKFYDAIITVLKMKKNEHGEVVKNNVVQKFIQNNQQPLQNKKILIVDDNLTNQEVVLKMVKYLRYIYTCANNGVEAIDKYMQKDCDLILMDCQMPEMDGYEATKKIRELENTMGYPHVPIVGLTAHALVGDREKCLNAGMDDYIAKPVKIMVLKSVLEQFLPTQSINIASNAIDIEQLKLIFKDDPSGLHNFFIKFISSTAALLQQIESMIDKKDFDAICKISHTLLGACSNVGANELYELTKQLDRATASSDWKYAKTILDAMYKALQYLKDNLPT